MNQGRTTAQRDADDTALTTAIRGTIYNQVCSISTPGMTNSSVGGRAVSVVSLQNNVPVMVNKLQPGHEGVTADQYGSQDLYLLTFPAGTSVNLESTVTINGKGFQVDSIVDKPTINPAIQVIAFWAD